MAAEDMELCHSNDDRESKYFSDEDSDDDDNDHCYFISVFLW